MTTRAIVGGQMATSGSVLFLSEAAEVAQNIETRLEWFYGEAFLELNRGTPWFQSILGKSNGQEREQALKKVILETTGVKKITSFELVSEDRTMKLTGSVLTLFSLNAIPFSVEI